MPGFHLTERVQAPLSLVFEHFSNVAQAGDKIPGIVRVEMLTPGPLGVGSRFRETRVMFKREHTETFEFTQYVPNELYELVANAYGTRYRTRFRFAHEGESTRVDVDFVVEAVSFFAKLMNPLAGLMMGTMKKCVQDDIAALRNAIEQPRAAA